MTTNPLVAEALSWLLSVRHIIIEDRLVYVSDRYIVPFRIEPFFRVSSLRKYAVIQWKVYVMHDDLASAYSAYRVLSSSSGEVLP